MNPPDADPPAGLLEGYAAFIAAWGYALAWCVLQFPATSQPVFAENRQRLSGLLFFWLSLAGLVVYCEVVLHGVFHKRVTGLADRGLNRLRALGTPAIDRAARMLEGLARAVI